MSDYLETAKAMAAEISERPAQAQEREIEVEVGVAAGVIPDEPGAAYRLGLKHGREGAAAYPTSDANCWACGKSRSMPSHQDQIRDLAEQHYQHSGVFHWHPDEFAALLELLDEQGPRAYLDAVVSRRPQYGTARIVRADRTVIDVNRRVLIARAKELKS